MSGKCTKFDENFPISAMEKYLVSARKYRPTTFASVVGQKALTTTLKNAVATQRLAHSYLFCGSRGVGKTSCARIFAKTINCLNPTPDGEACNQCPSCLAFNDGSSMNIVELDAASNNGVDDMRSLIEQVQVPPSSGRYRVFIVDEVHMLSSQAFNAFLKTLEEPPSYVVFILATTEKHKIIPTILSRCQIYDFHRITIQDIIDHLAFVASQEGIKAETAALNVIASKADGAMRDALSIFDQVAASSAGNITYSAAIENLNVLDYEYYHRLFDAFLNGDVLQSWKIYKDIRDHGFDSQFFINGLGSYFRDLMVARDPSTMSLIEAGDEVKAQLAARAAKCEPDFIYRAMSLLNDADLNYRAASSKQFLVEVTLAKICQPAGPSHSNSGNGEGRVKPIAAATKAQSQPAATATPEQTSRAATAQKAPEPVKPPETQHPPLRKNSIQPPPPPSPSPKVPGIPRISIRHSETVEQPQASATEKRDRRNPFSDDALLSAWETYIQTHPTAHILVNTMRAATPRRTDTTSFVIAVQNQMQLDMMTENRPELLSFLHDRLQNDFVDFSIIINEGEMPRHALSDRELLETLVKEFPAMARLIDGFQLRLS